MKATARRGFTLLELMLVLVVLAVSAALVVPRLSGALASLRVTKGTEQVFAAAREAHTRAVLRGLRARLVLEFEAGTFRVEEERRPLESPGRWYEMPGREGKPSALAEGVRFGTLYLNEESVAEGSATIGFRPDGTTDDALITVEDEDGDRGAVEVRGITGHVRILRDEELQEALNAAASAGPKPFSSTRPSTGVKNTASPSSGSGIR
jgi:prepilin-type N-terminal cleavage/methylation domain-containing protein